MSTAQLQRMLDRSKSYDESKVDYKESAKNISLDEDARVVMVGSQLFGGADPMGMTPHALTQLCAKIGPPQARYIKQCPEWLQSVNLNHWLKEYSDKSNGNGNWLLRTYGEHVRAFLTSEYAVINNTTAIEIARDTLETGGISEFDLIRSHVDADTLHLKVRVNSLDRDIGGEGYGSGFYIRNGETGTSSYVVAPFVQRNACTNSIIFLEGAFVQRHYRVQTGFLRLGGASAIGSALKLNEDYMERILAAQAEQLPNLGEIVGQIVQQRQLPQEVEPEILMGTEKAHTVMGLVNGLSYAAHATEGIDLETQVQMEAMAGAILATPDDIFGVLAKQVQYVDDAPRTSRNPENVG